MSEQNNEETAPEDIPLMQRILDNPFMLLFIGIAFPTLIYIVWGVMELISLPIAD